MTVCLVIGNLTAGVRYQARTPVIGNSVPPFIYECPALAVGVANMIMPRPASGLSPDVSGAQPVLLFTRMLTVLLLFSPPARHDAVDDAIARWSFDKGQPAGAGNRHLPACLYQILPLKSADKTYGLAAGRRNRVICVS